MEDTSGFFRHFRIFQTLLSLFTKGRINYTTSAAVLFWWNFLLTCSSNLCSDQRCFIVWLPVHQGFALITEESLIIISNCPAKLLRDLCIQVIVSIKRFYDINVERFLLTHVLHVLKPVTGYESGCNTYKFSTKVEYGKNRAFQHWYLQSFAWLGYFIAEDGCVCLPCCLFGSSDNSVQNFVQKLFRNWTNFNDKVKAHSTSSFHLKSIMAMESFKEAHSGLQPTIDT